MSTSHSGATAAEVRARLGYPVIDADAHVLECGFAILDFIRKVGGREMAEKYEALGKAARTGTRYRQVFWASPSGPHTLDRVTVMLPRLYAQRLDEAGIDFAIVYTSHGLRTMHVRDDELRRVAHRALNMLYADMFDPVKSRMIPSAVIPMYTPEEAVAELEFAVNELGYRTVTVNTDIRRDGALASPAIDDARRYDPVWAKCQELKVSVACHNRNQGPGTTRASPSNYIFNHLGGFSAGSEFFCRAVIFGGVASRFPALRFAFLEGGVHWGAALYNALFEYWEKRNYKALMDNLDPRKADLELMAEMFGRYGNDYLTADRIRAHPFDPGSETLGDAEATLDEWRESGIRRPGDIRDLFRDRFFFGCEADDRMNAVAFDRKLNHYRIKLNALLGSDIGHWDVIDMTGVIPEAHGLVEEGLMAEDDFRDFAFGHAVDLHAGVNPDFFKGTAVEDAAAKRLAEKSKTVKKTRASARA